VGRIVQQGVALSRATGLRGPGETPVEELITQRSQVQILPPLREKQQVRGPLLRERAFCVTAICSHDL
jgi:hypothetical protein